MAAKFENFSVSPEFPINFRKSHQISKNYLKSSESYRQKPLGGSLKTPLAGIGLRLLSYKLSTAQQPQPHFKTAKVMQHFYCRNGVFRYYCKLSTKNAHNKTLCKVASGSFSPKPITVLLRILFNLFSNS